MYICSGQIWSVTNLTIFKYEACVRWNLALRFLFPDSWKKKTNSNYTHYLVHSGKKENHSHYYKQYFICLFDFFFIDWSSSAYVSFRSTVTKKYRLENLVKTWIKRKSKLSWKRQIRKTTKRILNRAMKDGNYRQLQKFNQKWV